MVPGRSRVFLDYGIRCSYISSMKLTLQLQLLPTTDQEPVFLATMERFNEAASPDRLPRRAPRQK